MYWYSTVQYVRCFKLPYLRYHTQSTLQGITTLPFLRVHIYIVPEVPCLLCIVSGSRMLGRHPGLGPWSALAPIPPPESICTALGFRIVGTLISVPRNAIRRLNHLPCSPGQVPASLACKLLQSRRLSKTWANQRRGQTTTKKHPTDSPAHRSAMSNHL